MRKNHPLPWKQIVAFSAAGTLAAAAWLAFMVTTNSDQGGLVVAQTDSPAAGLITSELGAEAVADDGHDGAYFYVVARNPFDLDEAARHLDAPAYRLQRIGFPLAAWVLHPTGDGSELVVAMLVIGLASVAGASVATAVLGVTLGGKAWLGVIPGLLPGAVLGLRISAGDMASFALVLAAIALDARCHKKWAVVAAIAAVLTRETSLLILAGWFISRRDAPSARLVAIPTLIGAAWFLLLRLTVPAGSNSGGTIALPFVGIIDSADQWRHGIERGGMAIILGAVTLAVVALVKRGLSHPLAGIVGLQLLLLTIAAADVIGPERNASRTTIPIIVVSAIMLATPLSGQLPSARPAVESEHQ